MLQYSAGVMEVHAMGGAVTSGPGGMAGRCAVSDASPLGAQAGERGAQGAGIAPVLLLTCGALLAVEIHNLWHGICTVSIITHSQC